MDKDGSFSEKERERFLKLLLLAKESSFEGERKAALDAAERMAERFGLTLEEAAQISSPETPKAHKDLQSNEDIFWQWTAKRPKQSSSPFFDVKEAAASRERQKKWLDEEDTIRREIRTRRQKRSSRQRSRRMPAREFAQILIKETRFSLEEIAEITELKLTEVITLKLKLRSLKELSKSDPILKNSSERF